MSMKLAVLQIARPVIVLAALGMSYVLGIHAQQTPNHTSSSLLKTNWTGYLVVGRDETIDRMPLREPYPKALTEVEIGLRSDGVMVWRSRSKTK